MNHAVRDRQLRFLKSELRSAEARRDRWKTLGVKLGKANTTRWKSRLRLLDAEVELLRIMVQRTEIEI